MRELTWTSYFPSPSRSVKYLKICRNHDLLFKKIPPFFVCFLRDQIVCISGHPRSSLHFLHFVHIALEEHVESHTSERVESHTFQMSLHACHIPTHTFPESPLIFCNSACLAEVYPNFSQLLSAGSLPHYSSSSILHFSKHKISYNHTCSATSEIR